MSRTYVKSIRADAEERASADFAGHVLTGEGDGRWLFRNPEKHAYWFRVIAAPRTVIVYGDIGEVMFQPSDDDALGWLRSVLRRDRYDLSYVASKVPHSMAIVEFQAELVDAHIADLVEVIKELEDDWAEESDRPEEAQRLMDRIDETRDLIVDLRDIRSKDLFYLAIDGSDNPPDELPNVEGLSWHFMFQVAGIAQFCAALARHEKRVAP